MNNINSPNSQLDQTPEVQSKDNPKEISLSIEAQFMELVAQITSENLHGEIDTGEAVGQEVW